jgi:hypothetical protein
MKAVNELLDLTGKAAIVTGGAATAPTTPNSRTC